MTNAAEIQHHIMDRGLKQQLRLGSKGSVNETLRQTIVLEVIKLAAVLCQVFKNERQNHMEKPATAQAKEETTHS
jgi:hypothetical protein